MLAVGMMLAEMKSRHDDVLAPALALSTVGAMRGFRRQVNEFSFGRVRLRVARTSRKKRVAT